MSNRIPSTRSMNQAVHRYIGSDMDLVRTVAENMDAVQGVSDLISNPDATSMLNYDYFVREATALGYVYIGNRQDNVVGFVPSGSASAKSCWWESSINALITPQDDNQHDTTEYGSEGFWRVLGTGTVLEDLHISPKVGNWSDVVGQQIVEGDRLKGYEYPDGSGDVYAVKDSVTLPLTRPSTPENDSRFYLAGATNKSELHTTAVKAVASAFSPTSSIEVITPSNFKRTVTSQVVLGVLRNGSIDTFHSSHYYSSDEIESIDLTEFDESITLKNAGKRKLLLTCERILVSKQAGANDDEKFQNALNRMKQDQNYIIVVDNNFRLMNNYVIDFFVNITGACHWNSLSFGGTNKFLTFTTRAFDGSYIGNLSINGKRFDGVENFFQDNVTLLSIESSDPNDTGLMNRDVLFEHLRLSDCYLPLSLAACGSSSFDNIRMQDCAKGVRMYGVCLENSFLRPNILSSLSTFEFERYVNTPPQGSGDVPQGNYIVNGTLVLQNSHLIRDFMGVDDTWIANNCATVKGNCAFDYGFVNTWIECNLKHTNPMYYIGRILDFVQDADQYYAGSYSFKGCRLLGNKIRLSGGTATGWDKARVSGSAITDCDIALFRDSNGDMGFDVNNYLAQVRIRDNNIVVKRGDKRVATLNTVRDCQFDDNTVTYAADDGGNAWPVEPTPAIESPVFLRNTKNCSVSFNDFEYETNSDVDFITLQGSNQDYKIRSNSSPMDDTTHTQGDLVFYRKNGEVKVSFRTTTGTYSNAQTIATLPDWLIIKSANEKNYIQRCEFNVVGSNVTTYTRLTYDNGVIKFYGTGVDDMRGHFEYSLY